MSTESIERPEIGAGVVYRAHPHAQPEDGVVTGHSHDPQIVFVRYRGQHPSAPGKATRITDLGHA